MLLLLLLAFFGQCYVIVLDHLSLAQACDAPGFFFFRW